METASGIFPSRAAAEQAVRDLQDVGIPNERIVLLTPGMSDARVESAVPTADSEQPGMGQAMGGAVGAAMGVAGGATLGAAAASLLVPGVGPVIAAGILGAAILGAGGTAAGVAAGGALEKELEAGLPHDELYVYEDALRNGRSVVIAFVEQEGAIYSAQSALVGAGAESIDQARENWWVGLRDAEEAEYQKTGSNFQTDETDYRNGFENALKERSKQTRPEAYAEWSEAFRCGYDRGKSHQNALREKYKA